MVIYSIPVYSLCSLMEPERDWKLVTCSYSALYFHTYPMLFRRMLGIHTIFGAVFWSWERRNKHVFGESQRTKVKIHCCTVLRVLQWLVGFYVELFTIFLLTFVLLTRIKRPLLKVER